MRPPVPETLRKNGPQKGGWAGQGAQADMRRPARSHSSGKGSLCSMALSIDPGVKPAPRHDRLLRKDTRQRLARYRPEPDKRRNFAQSDIDTLGSGLNNGRDAPACRTLWAARDDPAQAIQIGGRRSPLRRHNPASVGSTRRNRPRPEVSLGFNLNCSRLSPKRTAKPMAHSKLPLGRASKSPASRDLPHAIDFRAFAE